MTFKEVFEDVVRYSIPDFPNLEVVRDSKEDLIIDNNQLIWHIVGCQLDEPFNLYLYNDTRYSIEILKRVVKRKEPKKVYIVAPRNAGLFPHIYFEISFEDIPLEQESPSYGPLFGFRYGHLYTFLGFEKDENGNLVSRKSLQDWIYYLQEGAPELLPVKEITEVTDLVRDLFVSCRVNMVLDYKKVAGGMGV